jgi:alcohol dehydrogenase YqhD (iron-dependent ADH family)
MALNGLVGLGNQNSWTVHPIEHELSAFYDITHGVGLGILTPRWMNFVLSEKSVAKFARFGRNVWGIQGEDDEAVAGQAIQATYDWVKSLEVPTTLPGVDINDDENFDAMAESAVTVGHLANGYVAMTPADVKALYQASMTTDGFE